MKDLKKIQLRIFKNGAGFTLLELLLAITLFCIIATAIYSSLAVGIKVYRRSSYIGSKYNDLIIALGRISKDLRSAVSINNIHLVNESQKIYFYSLQLQPSGMKELCKIIYTWNTGENHYRLLRLKETYPESVQETHAEGDEILDGIRELSFEYGYIKKGTPIEEAFEWKNEWQQEAVPKMVKINIKLENERFYKILFCPAGKMGETKE